jgi:hypothetical protein
MRINAVLTLVDSFNTNETRENDHLNFINYSITYSKFKFKWQNNLLFTKP